MDWEMQSNQGKRVAAVLGGGGKGFYLKQARCESPQGKDRCESFSQSLSTSRGSASRSSFSPRSGRCRPVSPGRRTSPVRLGVTQPSVFTGLAQLGHHPCAAGPRTFVPNAASAYGSVMAAAHASGTIRGPDALPAPAAPGIYSAPDGPSPKIFGAFGGVSSGYAPLPATHPLGYGFQVPVDAAAAAAGPYGTLGPNPPPFGPSAPFGGLSTPFGGPSAPFGGPSAPSRRRPAASTLELSGRLQETDNLNANPLSRDFRIATVENLVVVLNPGTASKAVCELVEKGGHLDFATLDGQHRPTGVGHYERYV